MVSGHTAVNYVGATCGSGRDFWEMVAAFYGGAVTVVNLLNGSTD